MIFATRLNFLRHLWDKNFTNHVTKLFLWEESSEAGILLFQCNFSQRQQLKMPPRKSKLARAGTMQVTAKVGLNILMCFTGKNLGEKWE